MKNSLLPFLLLCSLFSISTAWAQTPTEPGNTTAKKEKSPAVLTTPNFHRDLHPALRWTDESSYQPPASEKYIGLWEVKYAPVKWLNLSTWNLPWIVSAPSLKARIPIWSNERWAVGTSIGMVWMDVAEFLNKIQPTEGETPAVDISIIPIQLFGSYRLGERLLLSSSIRHYTISLGGDTQSSQAEIEGFAATDSTHFRLQLGWALSSKWSVWLISNQLVYQGVRGYTYTKMDLGDQGSLEMYLKGRTDALNFADANATGLRLTYHRTSFLMSMGFDKGNVPLFFLGFTGEEPISLPHFAMGWRF